MSDLAEQLDRSLAEGRSVARATIVNGPGAGRQMLIWPAGEIFGALGSPRLNQRVALFAEAQFSKNWQGTMQKRFDHAGQTLKVEFTVFQPQSRDEIGR